MAKGYLDALLNALPADIKRVIVPAFHYVADNWRLGDGDRATNAQWYRFTAVTSSNAGTEFSIRHGLNEKPSKLIPVLDLNSVGSQLVPLVVSRAPDAQRVYLSSSSTGASVVFYLEV